MRFQYLCGCVHTGGGVWAWHTRWVGTVAVIWRLDFNPIFFPIIIIMIWLSDKEDSKFQRLYFNPTSFLIITSEITQISNLTRRLSRARIRRSRSSTVCWRKTTWEGKPVRKTTWDATFSFIVTNMWKPPGRRKLWIKMTRKRILIVMVYTVGMWIRTCRLRSWFSSTVFRTALSEMSRTWEERW